MENLTLIETDQLSIGYSPTQPIAKDISLQIEKASLVAIIGVNGSGKSTLLKSLSGILPILQGDFFLNEKAFKDFTNTELAGLISLVLTKQHFSKNLSVVEFISLGRHPYTNWLGMTSRADKIIIAKAIKQVGVEHLKTKKCDELSDGQLQKVMIARALAQNTPAILMDEPTSHLDMYHKAQVLHLLKNITQETQKTIVFATHEINLALQLCDQIILIHDEKVIQQSPDELVENKALLNLFPKDLIVFDENSRSFRISTKKQT